MSTFKQLNFALLNIAVAASMGAAYSSWDVTFARKETSRVWKNIRFTGESMIKPVTAEDIWSMTDEEREILGFRVWDESGLLLLPLWAFNYIADGQVFTNIFGKKVTKGQDEIDLDTRGSCLAYGFMPPKVEQPALDTNEDDLSGGSF